jgi:hypothetical protein
MSVNARGVVVLSLALGGLALTSALVFWPSRPHVPAVVPVVTASEASTPTPATNEHAVVCDEIAKRYHDVWWSDATGCAEDADCTADTRAGIYSALDGCVRVGNHSLPHDAADTIAAQWVKEGCAWTASIDCSVTRAQCRWVSGGERCVERPPESVPREWQRLSLPAVMSVFAPPDFVEKEESEWGRHVRLFSGDHHTLTIALSPVSEAHARAGDRTSIDGHFAHVEHTGATWRVTFEEPWEKPDGPSELSLTMSCADVAACEPWQAVLHSIHLLTEPPRRDAGP